MKILFDTNVILDVLLARKEFVLISASLLGMVEQNKIEGSICATTITTLDYLISKTLGKKHARTEIKKLLKLFEIAEVNHNVLELSADSRFSDFEDAVQYYAGECSGADGLVTRNTKDYKNVELPIYTPEELWGIISASD